MNLFSSRPRQELRPPPFLRQGPDPFFIAVEFLLEPPSRSLIALLAGVEMDLQKA